ncbi:MAG: mechanosensitive ion channel family protein [Leptolyngbya sp. SIO1D8]|nr:mechanosensitive ion channel family protein [Leptolyngbya sp. SIO1D8]
MANRYLKIPKTRWIPYSLIGLITLLLCINISPVSSWAQAAPTPQVFPNEAIETDAVETTDIFSDSPLTEPLEQITPPGLRALFEDQDNIQVAPIDLDGRILFHVTSSIDGTWTASRRAMEIEQRLVHFAREIVASGSIEDLIVTLDDDDFSNQPVIYVNGEVLMTVTYLDASLDGTNRLNIRAKQISGDLEHALTQYYLERQPAFLWERARWAAALALLTLLGSYALTHIYQNLVRRRQDLQLDTAGQMTSAFEDNSSQIRRTESQNTLLTQQRMNSLRALQQTLQVSQMSLWLGSGFLLLGFFPYTRWLQPFIVGTLRLPLHFLLIILVAYGLIRLADVWVDWVFVALQTRTAVTPERSQRLALRLSTFSQVIKSILAVLIGAITFVILLSQLGVQVTPLLTGAGLVGVAISLASQNLIKDVINGFLILLEDQYGVGDVIAVRGVSGFVETMNLRITQLRDTGGQLITIPNSQIDIVQNLSKEWSRVDLSIPVGLTADINQALQLVENLATEMSKDSIWGQLILEPPLLLGVDHLDHGGAGIRIWIKTQPLKQWDVAREYRRRLKLAFEAAQIPIGVPQQIIQMVEVPKNITVTGSSTASENVTPTDLLEKPSNHPQT